MLSFLYCNNKHIYEFCIDTVFLLFFLLYLWKKMDFTKVTLLRDVRFHKERVYVVLTFITVFMCYHRNKIRAYMYISLQQQKSISTDWDQPMSAVRLG